jgi:hypothetical protein
MTNRRSGPGIGERHEGQPTDDGMRHGHFARQGAVEAFRAIHRGVNLPFPMGTSNLKKHHS